MLSGACSNRVSEENTNKLIEDGFTEVIGDAGENEANEESNDVSRLAANIRLYFCVRGRHESEARS